ncbi:hypothetical protein [Natrinema sp. SYSU A 869]|uniref:hypothetical protein n=1 Tax=Natrinema sp. SYSU A 869 TaxID=2871694 RepID=UPI001CA431DE|nr:hypothetical protein [Natrinema sp. SYSU A 869]
MAEGEDVWLYAAIDTESKVVLHTRLSLPPGTKPATQFLRDLKEKLRVCDAEFSSMGWGI